MSDMSYSGDMYTSSSYRKIFGDAPRRVPTASYRSGAQQQHQHRTYGSPSPMTISSSYRTKRGFQPMPDTVDLTQTTAITNELKIIRTNEKEQLQGLNDRFVTFIEKVHNLEQHNKVLEAEVALLRQRHSEPSRLHDLYEQEIRELRARVEELTHEKSQMHLDCVQMNEALERLKDKLEEESRLREEAESSLKGYRKDVAARNNDALKQSKDELSEYRRQLQARTLEIEALKAHNEALERQLAEMEDHQNNEIGELPFLRINNMQNRNRNAHS
uniref:Zgc:65851 n=1 Tax=Sinocyclocheilus grahami TaxID=75366 RepID=A0A672PMX6_SINGR